MSLTWGTLYNKKIDVKNQKSGIFGSGSKIILYRPKIHASEKEGNLKVTNCAQHYFYINQRY